MDELDNTLIGEEDYPHSQNEDNEIHSMETKAKLGASAIFSPYVTDCSNPFSPNFLDSTNPFSPDYINSTNPFSPQHIDSTNPFSTDFINNKNPFGQGEKKE